MRIDRSTVGQVSEKSGSESGKTQVAKTDEPAHKVNVSDAASAIAHRQKAHAERLAKVRAELESGTYRVDW